MLKNLNEILFAVARDFVELTPLQQINVGIRLKVCGAEAALMSTEQVGEYVFRLAYQNGKIPALVREMKTYLYESS